MEGKTGGSVMSKWFTIAVSILILIAMVGCAPGPNGLDSAPNKEGHVAGFWRGLWHGFILLFTFIISLFKDNMTVYEVHNNGNWYNLGYLLGVMMFFGGGGASRRSCGR